MLKCFLYDLDRIGNGSTESNVVYSLSFGFNFRGQLKQIEVAYQTYGVLNKDKTNAILICHALTGDAEPCAKSPDQRGWWENFMGDGLALDTSRYFLFAPMYWEVAGEQQDPHLSI